MIDVAVRADERLARAHDPRAVHVDDRVLRDAAPLDVDQVELGRAHAARPHGAERARGDGFRQRSPAGAARAIAPASDLAAAGERAVEGGERGVVVRAEDDDGTAHLALGQDVVVEPRAIEAGDLRREGERREGGEQERQALGPCSAEDGRGHQLRAEGVADQVKPLQNEKYIGTWVWNKTRFLKDPDSGRRGPVPRPREEWVRQERPDLRIIDDALWDAVQTRLRFVRAAYGCGPGHQVRGSAPIAYSPHLRSGILRCGVCGARMIAQRFTRKKRDKAYSYSSYTCGFAASKGRGRVLAPGLVPGRALGGGAGREVPRGADAVHGRGPRPGDKPARGGRRPRATRARRPDQGRDPPAGAPGG